MEKWAEKFNLPLPECNKCGTCCLCASPSKSYKELLQKASEGDEFARDFFSIFIPYKNFDEAKKIFSLNYLFEPLYGRSSISLCSRFSTC